MKKITVMVVLLGCLASLCCCSSKNKTLDLEAVKAAVVETKVFDTAMFSPSNEQLASAYGIDSRLMENHVIAVAVLTAQPCLYIVALPRRGGEIALKTQLDEFLKNHETIWATRKTDQPEQYELVVNRLETTLSTKEGVYYVYIISSDNGAILNAIKSSLVS